MSNPSNSILISVVGKIKFKIKELEDKRKNLEYKTGEVTGEFKRIEKEAEVVAEIEHILGEIDALKMVLGMIRKEVSSRKGIDGSK